MNRRARSSIQALCIWIGTYFAANAFAIEMTVNGPLVDDVFHFGIIDVVTGEVWYGVPTNPKVRNGGHLGLLEIITGSPINKGEWVKPGTYPALKGRYAGFGFVPTKTSKPVNVFNGFCGRKSAVLNKYVKSTSGTDVVNDFWAAIIDEDRLSDAMNTLTDMTGRPPVSDPAGIMDSTLFKYNIDKQGPLDSASDAIYKREMDQIVELARYKKDPRVFDMPPAESYTGPQTWRNTDCGCPKIDLSKYAKRSLPYAPAYIFSALTAWNISNRADKLQQQTGMSDEQRLLEEAAQYAVSLTMLPIDTLETIEEIKDRQQKLRDLLPGRNDRWSLTSELKVLGEEFLGNGNQDPEPEFWPSLFP